MLGISIRMTPLISQRNKAATRSLDFFGVILILWIKARYMRIEAKGEPLSGSKQAYSDCHPSSYQAGILLKSIAATNATERKIRQNPSLGKCKPESLKNADLSFRLASVNCCSLLAFPLPHPPPSTLIPHSFFSCTTCGFSSAAAAAWAAWAAASCSGARAVYSAWTRKR
jgi:hypothetical protein